MYSMHPHPRQSNLFIGIVDQKAISTMFRSLQRGGVLVKTALGETEAVMRQGGITSSWGSMSSSNHQMVCNIALDSLD